MSVPEISVDDLAQRLADGVRVVDVREDQEYLAGHIPGAVHVALGTVPDHVDRYRGEGPTYVVCLSGGRSQRACEFIAQHGVEVVNVAGGTRAWVESGRSVVEGSSPT